MMVRMRDGMCVLLLPSCVYNIYIQYYIQYTVYIAVVGQFYSCEVQQLKRSIACWYLIS
jgi:hypothetical protein